MGALFSLTPPLLEAVDDIKRMITKYRKPAQPTETAGDEPSLETTLKELRAQENRTAANGSSSREYDASKHYSPAHFGTGLVCVWNTQRLQRIGLSSTQRRSLSQCSIPADGTIRYPSAGSRRDRCARSNHRRSRARTT